MPLRCAFLFWLWLVWFLDLATIYGVSMHQYEMTYINVKGGDKASGLAWMWSTRWRHWRYLQKNESILVHHQPLDGWKGSGVDGWCRTCWSGWLPVTPVGAKYKQPLTNKDGVVSMPRRDGRILL